MARVRLGHRVDARSTSVPPLRRPSFGRRRSNSLPHALDSDGDFSDDGSSPSCGSFDDSPRLGPADGSPKSKTSNAKASKHQRFHKVCWRTVCGVGQRRLAKLASTKIHKSTLFYYDAKKYPGVVGSIALTIDDAPCSGEGLSMAKDVQTLLAEFEAKATFFLCTDFVPGHEDELESLVRAGHEVGNHCPEDRSYAKDSESDFEQAFLKAEGICENIRRAAGVSAAKEGSPRWFRAPHAALSAGMTATLERHGFTNVLCDCYANDPWIPDSNFISQRLVSDARDGSILCIHMPEKGFREYNFEALRSVLQGVRQRGFSVVTVSELRERSTAAVEAPLSPRSSWRQSMSTKMTGGRISRGGQSSPRSWLRKSSPTPSIVCEPHFSMLDGVSDPNSNL